MSEVAGWYPDPESSGHLRYWDGQAWTEHRAPQTPPPIAPEPPTVAPTSHSAPPKGGPLTRAGTWFTGLSAKGVTFLIVGVVVAVAVIGAAIDEIGSAPSSPARSATPTTASPAVTGESTQSPSPSATQTTSVSSERDMTLGLDGEGNSKPFSLEGGDYKVTWKTGGNCYYGVDLTPTNRGFGDTVFSADRRTTGTQYLYGVKPGDYYLSAITGPPPGCPWEATFIAQ